MTDVDYPPTREQQAAIDLFGTGGSLAIEAGAGTGKTSTLVMLGRAAGGERRRGAYVAFNKAIVNDAGEKMPANVSCSTAHSLAFRQVGRHYAHRLRTPRMRSQDIARMLRVDPITVTFMGTARTLAAGYLAGYVMRGVQRFCQSADVTPTIDHLPYIDGIDEPTSDGRRSWGNNMAVRRHVAGALQIAWDDLMRHQGTLPYRHDHYLKAWQLSGPVIPADFILFDEAQDANPVMVAIVSAQRTAQLVFVGDSQQAIYEFTGAVNALAGVPADQRTFLTQSFRFGGAIAEIANGILGRIDGAQLRLVGHPGLPSVVAEVADPDVLLTRTNATAVRALLTAQLAGQRPALVGGAADVLAFCRGAADLKEGRPTGHPDLACFQSWGEVQEYVAMDEQGGELKLLVDLVDTFGVQAIIVGLSQMPAERDADLVISTAHKSKGREWPTVKLADDFPSPDERDVDVAEWRLLYVAATRARRELDITQVPHAAPTYTATDNPWIPAVTPPVAGD